jgi:hypothetical protein
VRISDCKRIVIRKCLDKKRIINKFKAIAHYKIDSETEPEMTLRRRERDFAKLRHNEGITQMSITSHYISTENKGDTRNLLGSGNERTGRN